MNRKVELTNVEIKEYCMLNLDKNKMKFYKDNKKIKGFTGLYFRDENNFLGIYPTEKGPYIYYEGKEYEVNKDLTMILERDGKDRVFKILEYDIEINYKVSKRLGWDCWSMEEEDVDLFVRIINRYKTKELYDKYTLKNKGE